MKIAFDIGANTGVYTDWFLLNGYDKVICVEPSYEFKTLEDKYKNNPKVILINKALSNYIGELQFYECHNCTALSTANTDWINKSRFTNQGKDWRTAITVKCITLDSLIAEYGSPYFIKVDVEGYEYNVLQGYTKKDNNILTFEWAEELSQVMNNCQSHLFNLGYSKFFCQYNSDDLSNQPTILDYKEWDVLDVNSKLISNRQQLGGMIYCI